MLQQLIKTVTPPPHPILTIIVDSEEEFDWDKPFHRENRSVKNLAHQEQAQKIFQKHNIKPTYVVDYSVSSDSNGYQPLKEFLTDNLCEIGAHCHPWINPPYLETINNINSYPGNLSYSQEFGKLQILTQSIEDNFNIQPSIYKAGRYGLGKNTTSILSQLNYRIDCSVVPNTNYTAFDGPNFSDYPTQPYWFGTDKLLELPLSVDYVGKLSTIGNALFRLNEKKALRKLRLSGIFSKLGFCERIKLTPEGHTFDELKRLTLSRIKQQQYFFCLSYHSSSMLPGCTTYVKNQVDLNRFLCTLSQYLDFFKHTLKGQFYSTSKIEKMFREHGH